MTDMAKQRMRRYSIEIKDDSGKTVIFTAADWTADERRVAVAHRPMNARRCPDA